jgi:hypothetical protein
MMQLQWTEPAKPNEKCSYDHCTAQTPFGRFLITWKSWKEFDDYTIDETPWGDFFGSDSTLEEAKASCQRAFEERVQLCL